MKHVTMLKALPAVVIAAAMCISCGEKKRDFAKEAQELQKSILTIDTHTDTPMRLWNESYDITADNATGCIDFPKMKKGLLDVETFAVYTGQGARDTATTNRVYQRALATLDKIMEVGAKHSDIVAIVTSPEEMIKYKKEGKLMIFPSIENSYPIGTDIYRVREFYKKGVRMFGLCHSYNNDISDSSSDKNGPEHNGLSPFGKELVKELNRIGGIIDVSHASDKTVLDVFELSKAPIVASHSSVRAIAHHDRNFSDEMLEGLKKNGGVIQICILDSYVKDFPVDSVYLAERAVINAQLRETPSEQKEVRDSLRQVLRDIKARYPDQNATIADYVDHIDYVVNKIGIDYVGIGTDFDGGGGVSDCKDASQMVGITEELLRRGYSKEQIEKIWGGNFLRVFNQVIEYAKSQNCE